MIFDHFAVRRSQNTTHPGCPTFRSVQAGSKWWIEVSIYIWGESIERHSDKSIVLMQRPLAAFSRCGNTHRMWVESIRAAAVAEVKTIHMRPLASFRSPAQIRQFGEAIVVGAARRPLCEEDPLN